MIVRTPSPADFPVIRNAGYETAGSVMLLVVSEITSGFAFVIPIDTVTPGRNACWDAGNMEPGSRTNGTMVGVEPDATYRVPEKRSAVHPNPDGSSRTFAVVEPVPGTSAVILACPAAASP